MHLPSCRYGNGDAAAVCAHSHSLSYYRRSIAPLHYPFNFSFRSIKTVETMANLSVTGDISC